MNLTRCMQSILFLFSYNAWCFHVQTTQTSVSLIYQICSLPLNRDLKSDFRNYFNKTLIMGLNARSPVSGGLRTLQAQINLRIRAV